MITTIVIVFALIYLIPKSISWILLELAKNISTKVVQSERSRKD